MPAKGVFQVLGLSIAAMLLTIFGVGYILSDRWQVETRRSLEATPAQVTVLLHDLRTWPKWADLMLDLGAPTKQVVEGEAGQAGQRIVWTGPMGTVVMQLTAVQPDAVEYQWTMQAPTDAAANELSVGRIEWRADGARCAIIWREWRQMTAVVERWSAWFGAKQERIRQMQGSGLEGLAQQFEAGAGTGR